MKRRAVDLFNLQDELDVFARLEFELFAFGILPTSSSLPLLRDREVLYVNLLPPRPPTPFSLTLAPPRAENSLVAEVRRPGTGLPFEVVYTQQTLAPPVTDAQQFGYEGSGIGGSGDGAANGPKPRRLKSRFREHMSETGSRHSRNLSANEPDSAAHSSKSRQRSPGAGKVWYKDTEGSPVGPSAAENRNPFTGIRTSTLVDEVNIENAQAP